MSYGTSRAFTSNNATANTVTRRIVIQAIDPTTGWISGVDSTGKLYNIVNATQNVSPQLNETWMINRSGGFWTLATKVGAPQSYQTISASYEMVSTDRLIVASPPSSTTITVTLSNPLAGVLGVVYAIKNITTGSGLVKLTPYASEVLYASSPAPPNADPTYGAGGGTLLVTDKTNWYTVS